ncbi:MAG: hypothetical protein HZY76_03555 [Anaerolineae bacterium]|nr:MAG: hypothetical protein HZY76_03555 [Anaerolineae bacterium]
MTRHLVAAEADKIQDFVFRASHLREVTGGSSLLRRFCQEVPRKCLGCQDDDIVISDGGAFRLLFDTRAKAIEGSSMLADLYYLATGCSLTVAEPVEWDGDEATFPKANELAGSQLRAAKRAASAAATPHLPQMAFCASTGVELASAFAAPKKDRQPTYLSPSSLIKKSEWIESKEELILDFVQHVIGANQSPDDFDVPTEPGNVGRAGGYEPRDYVAYLVADGNGMGALFGQCKTRGSLHALSLRLSEIVRDSLAEATKHVMKYPPRDETSRLVPVLPLILGGDDVFILLPAKWAISFAQEFCHSFEQQMETFQRQQPDLIKAPKSTMSAAVVICKSKYPFYLAHQRGEALLKEAKRLNKSQPQSPMSVVNFELIVGNRLVDHNRTLGEHRPTLRPYWIGDPPDAHPSVQQLLVARLGLQSLPQKRQAQLRAFFEPPALQTKDPERAKWREDLEKLATRIGKLGDDDSITAHYQGFLGRAGWRPRAYYWRSLDLNTSGNALPEVLDMWSFLYDLKQDQKKYKEAAS